MRLLQAVGAASIVLAAMYFTVPSLMIGDGIFVSALAVFVVGILGWRLLFNYLLGSLKMEERILVVGTGNSARKVVRQILDQREFAYRVIGFIDDDSLADRRADRQSRHRRNAGRHGGAHRHAPDRSDRRRPVGSAREASDRGIAAREDGGDPRRGCDHDLRAGHGQDPHRRLASELADLLRRLPRVENDPLAEALDRSHVVAGSRDPRQPADAPDRDRDPHRVRPAGVLLPGACRRERQGVHAVQVPIDAAGRRKGRDADLGDRRRQPDYAGRPVHPQDAARRAPADLERAGRRDELRGAAARAACTSSRSWPRRSRSISSGMPSSPA